MVEQLDEYIWKEKPMLELRLLNDDDIPLVEVWLNKEHVKNGMKYHNLVFQLMTGSMS